MKIYADTSVRRSRQLLGDVLLVVWVALWVKLSLVVHDATMMLAGPGEQMSRAGAGLAEQLRDAGASVGSVPLVGDDVRVPFDGAGDAADKLAGAGDAQVAAVTDLAFWLGLTVAAIPILLALAVYLPPRWRFVRDATAGQRFVDAGEDLDLFALRAMARQPMHRLARVSDDPAGAWRRRDAAVVRALAELELRDTGLAPPAR
ncbi:MAG TPA: hypothetical protein VFG63_11610 [Nocardioidaceae bacterium]|nr:hypothetical protein [Nocardioidaceae bacterium]